jgi:hypothetical protein
MSQINIFLKKRKISIGAPTNVGYSDFGTTTFVGDYDYGKVKVEIKINEPNGNGNSKISLGSK